MASLIKVIMPSRKSLVLFCFFFSLAHCSSVLMDLCHWEGNSTVTPGSNITWGLATAQPIQKLLGGSYLRPAIGGALLPWIYSLVVLLIHIPVVIIRVVRWEVVQNWCLAGTLLSVVITIQGYSSTGFQSSMILTWTPLLLVIEAGSMAQVMFLLNEDYKLIPRLRHLILYGQDSAVPEVELANIAANHDHDDDPDNDTDDNCENPPPRHPLPLPPNIIADSTPLLKSKPLPTLIVSVLLFTTVIILQILGLAHASRQYRLPPPTVSWCSPIFQPFGVAALDAGTCTVFPVEQSFAKGVGCINIRGSQQAAWLVATVAGTSVSLVLEVIDVIVLATVQSSTRWRGIKMRRPWFTMIAGVIALALVLVFGILYASVLPPGVSERVWVIAEIPGVVDGNGNNSTTTATAGYGVRILEGKIGPSGLRGAMIGWNDGVFQGWNGTWFGNWGSK